MNYLHRGSELEHCNYLEYSIFFEKEKMKKEKIKKLRSEINYKYNIHIINLLTYIIYTIYYIYHTIITILYIYILHIKYTQNIYYIFERYLIYTIYYICMRTILYLHSIYYVMNIYNILNLVLPNRVILDTHMEKIIPRKICFIRSKLHYIKFLY